MLAVLANAYREEEVEGDTRIVLAIKSSLAPSAAATAAGTRPAPRSASPSTTEQTRLSQDEIVNWLGERLR